MTSIEKLIENIENELEAAWQLPMSGGKVLIDAKEIMKMVEEVKQNLPMEIIQAKKIVQNRSNIIEKAKSEAEIMIKTSEEKIRELINKNEIVKAAEVKAESILNDAISKAKELRISSNQYAANIMKQLDETVENSLSEIKKVREVFKN